MAAAVVMARSMAGAVSRCWHSYVGLLDRYPARTVSVNTAVLMTSGDLIAQLVLEKRHRTRDFDSARTLRFFGVGLLLAGPTMHAWYVPTCCDPCTSEQLDLFFFFKNSAQFM